MLSRPFFVLVICALTPQVIGLQTAAADIVATDDFSYPDGDLFGANGGIGWISPWAGNGMAASGGQAISDNFGNPPKFSSRQIDNPGSTGELFISLDLTTTAAIGINEYFGVGLSLGANNNLLGFGKFVGNDQFLVGNGGLSSGPGNIVIQPGTTYRLIGAYSMNPDPGADLVMLWVDPDAADYFDATTRTTSANAFHDDSVAFHAATLTIYAEQAGIRFDNIVISNDPAGVGLLSEAPGVLGDVNCDGFVNLLDVNPFVALLTSGGFSVKADINQDGLVNLLDIGPFVALLVGP